MALTNNTKFRYVTITINKEINDAPVSTGGFPITHSILTAFTGFLAISNADFDRLPDSEYLLRLGGFYDYLEATYPFFNRNSAENPSSGTDAVLCPLDNTPAPTVNVTSSDATVEPVSGGTVDDHLSWRITIDQPAPYPLRYEMKINIYDRNANILRVQNVNGFIQTGEQYNDSREENTSIRLDEAYNNALAPLNASVVPGSESVSA